MDLQSVNRRDPKFSKTLQAGFGHLKSLMEIYHWQSEVGGLQEDPHQSWSQSTQALRTLESVSRARVTKTKQFGAFLTYCHPIVEELGSSSTNPGMLPISFATSFLRGLRRALEEVTGAIDSADAGPTVHCAENSHMNLDKFHTTRLLDCHLTPSWWLMPLMFMRKVHFYHGDPVSYLDKSGLKAIGTRWVHTNKGDAANPFIRARLVAQETKTVSELAPEDSSSTFVATLPLESPKMMLSRCVNGKRRTPAEEKVLGLYDICRANFQSLARRTIVIKVPREDDECTSGYAVLDDAMYGTNDAAQCFDVASENAMTAMEYDTGTFSHCLYHSSAVDMCVCVCSDTATILWRRAREHNKRSLRNSCPNTSSSSIFPSLDHAQHSETSQKSGN